MFEALPHDPALLWLLFVLYCFIGWVVECTYCSMPARHFINRGFLNGPVLPIYGCGSIAGLALFGTETRAPLIFLLGGALCCALEYVTSWTMEKLYHARWWDYSNKPLNVQGRFWAGGFVEFGAGICVVVLVVNPPVLTWIEQLQGAHANGLAIVTFALFLADLIVSHKGASKMREHLDQLAAEAREKAEALAAQTREKAEEARAKASSMAVEGRERMDAAVAEGRERAETLAAEGRERAAALSAEGRERADELLARADVRKHLAHTEEWELALDWHLSQLRAAQKQLYDVRPNLPQLPALDEAAEHFRNRMTAQEQRMLAAFPKLRPTEYHSLANELARRFREDDKA